MEFVISRNNIEEKRLAFLYEEEAFEGVKKIADKVRRDLMLVFSCVPSRIDFTQDMFSEGIRHEDNECSYPVIFGTAGRSALLDELDKKGLIRLSEIREKREVYLFDILDAPFEGTESALVIAGSDKRGTIYGLFHLSSLLGVSPLVDWLDITPDEREEAVFNAGYKMVSKEPSVKYRGFFINDEWPAFGNWASKNYGGFNSDMYEHVFELLLRLKGNYLWPAMWSSRFSEDGPGLKNAELADELGIIMGTSHHEPCSRHGEEYKYLRGPESVYGDAWDFRKNEEGITRFWEDGLKRNGRFENIITVGMRGEFDSRVMGEDASLKDNIELLSDVLKRQNALIRENINEDLSKVPRIFALYKEVEPFFYGDEFTQGLIDSPELDGVTLMLCDDNFGNLRTLPTEHMSDHKGGYGMYYHFDYHGFPVSYEWVNSTSLPKVWEQMTTAYEFGVRELWIVNVGDIFTNEYPLSYFMDLAYDYDKWGIKNIDSPREYNRHFVNMQFGSLLSDADKGIIADLLAGYTGIANIRRPESMNDRVYHPVNFGELEDLSLRITELMETADRISKSGDERSAFAFFELVGYPLVATLNHKRMWLAACENHYLAGIGAGFSRKLGAEIRTRIKLDRSLTEQLHEIRDGKWYGMGMSEHTGFKYWNEEECAYPLIYDLEPAEKKRLIVSIPGTCQHTEGGVWTGKKLVLPDFLDPSCNTACITLYSAGRENASYKVISDISWLTVSEMKGSCLPDFYENIRLEIKRDEIKDRTSASIFIQGDFGETEVYIPVNNDPHNELPKRTYIWCGRDDASVPGFDPYNYISISAEHFASANETGKGRFVKLEDYGKTGSAMKAFPVNARFEPLKDAPSLDYRLFVNKEDEYEVDLYLSPSNPVTTDNEILYAISAASGDLAGCARWDEEYDVVNSIPEDFMVGDDNEIWAEGVLDNIRISTARVLLGKGLNTLRIYAMTPGFVLQKLVIHEVGAGLPDSYLGPPETRCVSGAPRL